jgi:NTE family protein
MTAAMLWFPASTNDSGTSMTSEHALSRVEDVVPHDLVSEHGSATSDDASRIAEAASPVEPDDRKRAPQGTALCLSGGGYRAMLFHVGALWRLNELGYLPRLDRVSSVSGGSITAGALASSWSRLAFEPGGVATNFGEVLVEPIRRLATKTVDVPSVLRAAVTKGTAADYVARAYRRHLFGGATLQDLPDRPRFIINATNLQSGALWRFSKLRMADYRVGVVPAPQVPLAVAVAASSAFPPVLSPLRLTVDPKVFQTMGKEDLAHEPYTSRAVLSDGGVYDNLGLETAWKQCATVLVSDGGGQMAAEETVPSDWARHAIRVNGVIDNQVRSLRRRQLVAAYVRGVRAGAYWGIRTDIEDYAPVPGLLPCPHDRTLLLARTPTRLKRMDGPLQERLINWGYAVCDAAMRRRVETTAAPPASFPYSSAGIG